MKINRFAYTLTLSLSLGVTALMCASTALYAQEERDEAKPQQQPESRPEATKPQEEPRPDAKPAERNDDKAAKQEQDKDRNKDKAAKQDDKAAKQVDRNAQSDKAPRTSGKTIPDDKFRSHFGREHKFTVHTTVSGGQPRFQYGGYSFAVVDAWPAEWAYSDDCYIDYIDGEYFLFDLAHPGIRIAVIIL